jgi:hypothetical protein
LWYLQDFGKPSSFGTYFENAKSMLHIDFLFYVSTFESKLSAFQHKTKKPTRWAGLLHLSVVPPGIEPGTQGFSVLCSTD